jgi:hypothetical protein
MRYNTIQDRRYGRLVVWCVNLDCMLLADYSHAFSHLEYSSRPTFWIFLISQQNSCPLARQTPSLSHSFDSCRFSFSRRFSQQRLQRSFTRNCHSLSPPHHICGLGNPHIRTAHGVVMTSATLHHHLTHQLVALSSPVSMTLAPISFLIVAFAKSCFPLLPLQE